MRKIVLNGEQQQHTGLTIMIFAEGTIIKPKAWFSRYNHNKYIPIENAVKKIKLWKQQGASIIYVTSRKKKQAEDIVALLKRYGFPGAYLAARDPKESYKDIIEKISPDILIEDDCKSIGGAWQMCLTKVCPEIKEKIVSIVVPEFKGIDYLPDKIESLKNVKPNTSSYQLRLHLSGNENCTIREIKASEYNLLNDFLYEAIFQRDFTNLVPRSIINNPELQVYTKDFGKQPDDYGLFAEVNGKVVGAVWLRNIKGFGSIDDITPEFAISLYREYRGQGIGTEMMKKMLQYLKEAGYSKASLAVQKDNYAVKMYQKTGFQIMDENAEEYIMVHDLNR